MNSEADIDQDGWCLKPILGCAGLIIGLVLLFCLVTFNTHVFFSQVSINIEGINGDISIEQVCYVRSGMRKYIRTITVSAGKEIVLPEIGNYEFAILPHQPVISQEIYVKVNGFRYPIWLVSKGTYSRMDEHSSLINYDLSKQGVIVSVLENEYRVEVDFERLIKGDGVATGESWFGNDDDNHRELELK